MHEEQVVQIFPLLRRERAELRGDDDERKMPVEIGPWRVGTAHGSFLVVVKIIKVVVEEFADGRLGISEQLFEVDGFCWIKLDDGDDWPGDDLFRGSIRRQWRKRRRCEICIWEGNAPVECKYNKKC